MQQRLESIRADWPGLAWVGTLLALGCALLVAGALLARGSGGEPAGSHPLVVLLLLAGGVLTFALAVLLAGRQRNVYRALRDAERRHLEIVEDVTHRFRLILNEATDGIVLTDATGAVVEANRSYARMLGYDEGAVSRLHLWDWDVELDTREKFLARYERVKATPGRLEAKFRRADGTIIDVEISFTPVVWDGKPCLFSVCHDITERKLAEEALRQSEQRFRLFAEFVPVLTWITDAEGLPYYFNQRWADYTGVMPQTGQPAASQEIVHPEDWNRVFDEWRAALSAGSQYTTEVRLRRYDGTYRWFVSRAMPLRDADGRVLRWLGVCSDIDDMRTAQARLEHSLELRTRDLIAARDQAETANRVKDIFLATMSHELRTPLNSIIGFSDVLLSGIAGELNDEQQRQLGIVRQAGQQLLGLVAEVLDISRIETGQLALESEALELAPLMAEQREAFALQAQERGLAFEVRPPDGAVRVRGDARRVRQVLGNLLSNAFKYTDTGGVRVWTDVEPDCVRIHVEDSGVGIAPADLEKLFRPFYRATRTHGRQRDGTGLGLAVSRRLAQAMGGTVDVTSEVGRGSRFDFTLPRVP